MRVAYFDPATSDYAYGSWSDLELRLEAHTNILATVSDLQLEDANNDSPPTTTDPTIVGSVLNPDGYTAFVTVEFDTDADPNNGILGTATTDADGNFSFSPQGLSTGTITIHARAADWDYTARQEVFGPWTLGSDAVTFVLEEPEPLEVASFGLQSDTGILHDDQVTANALLTGKIAGDFALGEVTIAIDQGDDSTIDATVTTNAEGSFSYHPNALSFGVHTFRAQVATWDSDLQVFSYSTGLPITFTLEDQGNAPAEIIALELANPPVSGIAQDPTIVGRIVNEGELDGVTIEFDFDTDDNNGINQSTTTDDLGNFVFLPTLLPVGTANIRARTREVDSENGQILVSGWVSLASFDYQPVENQLPTITNLTYAPSNNTPRVTGNLTDDRPEEDLTVEFSLSENGPIIGTTSVTYFGSFSFDVPDLDAGQSYTIWARAKELVDENAAEFQYSAPISTSFTYQLNLLGVVEFGLLNDTNNGGLGTGDDGSTEDSTLHGQIAGTASISGRTVEVKVDTDSDGYFEVSDSVTTDASGQFQYNFTAAEPGFYSAQARVVGSGSYHTWQVANFVFDTNDSSPQALALVNAFGIIDANWKTSKDFDEVTAGNVASDLYQLALDQAGAEYDFEVALAELLRKAAEDAADSNYDQQKASAEAAYNQAIDQAQADFIAALNALPEADRATYDLGEFIWPTAPGANALDLPSDGSQSRPPQAPTYSGAAFDPTNDPIFRSAVAQAERDYFEAVRLAEQQYEQDLDGVEQTYRDEVEAAQDAFEVAARQASDAYDTARQSSNNPTFDDATYQGFLDEIADAWEDYRDTVRANNERYSATTQNTSQKREEAINQTYIDQFAAEDEARDNAYDDNCEHPSFGTRDSDRYYSGKYYCSYEPDQEGFWYDYTHEGQEKSATSTRDSPGERVAYVKAEYQIRQRFANKRKDIENNYKKAVENALESRDVANAKALNTALINVYDAQRHMAHLSRDFRHDTLVDSLDDSQQFTVDMAGARDQLQQALADAETMRAKRVADKVYVRDDFIAASQRDRDQAVASARLSATQYWAQSVGTLWSGYQLDLATNANDYSQQVTEEALARNQAKNDAVHEETYVVADAQKQKTIKVAAADYTRTIELADALRTFQIDVDATYTTRDKSLADEWRDYRIDVSEALKTHRVDLAEIKAEYNIKDGESVQKEAAILAWAYDIRVADWYGIQWRYELDNSDRRESARRTRAREAAEIARDRTLDQIDANEKLDLDRIQAVEDYRKDTAETINTAAKEVAGHHFTYQTEVASIQDDYHVAVVTAVATYTVEVTRGEALKEYQTIQADGNFDVAEAPLSKTRNIADATAQKIYEVGEANAYVSLINAWAAAAPARWATYQTGLAEAERDRATAVGNARVTRATSTGSASVGWIQTVSTADIDYAAAMYGGAAGGGALVERAQTIADAHVTIAENGSLVTYATAQAAAVKTHDQGVADQNKTFSDALATADATRDREVSKAAHDYSRAVARANYQRNKPDGISNDEYNDRVAEAEERRSIRVARANEKRSVAAAEDRRSWTVGVGELNVQFVKDLVAAQQDRAAVLRAETNILATAVATGQSTYLSTETDADAQRNISVAGADSTYENSAAGAAATYAQQLDAALSVKSEADAAALGVYEVGLYADHASSMASEHTSTGTSLSLYRKLVAAADHTWAIAKASARNLFHQTLSSIEAARVSAITGADVAHTSRSAAASLAYSTQKATADSNFLADLATTDATLYIAQQTAQADLTVAATDAQGAADIAYAEAVRDRDNAYADANVQWVKTTAAANTSRVAGDITVVRYQEIVTAASETRDKAKQAADEAFERALDDAGAEEVQALGTARIAYVHAVGGAKTTHVVSSNSATQYNATRSAQLDNQLTASLASSTETHQNQLLSADHAHTVSSGAQDVAYEERLRDAGATLAGGRAAAEAGYQLSEAQATAAYWAGEASTYPNDDYVRFRAAESATRAAWFTALVTPYGTFRTAVAQAAGQADVDLTAARVARVSSRSAATVTHDNAVAAEERRRSIELTAADNEAAVASVLNENSVSEAIVGADHTYSLAYVEAVVAYDIAADAINRNDDLSTSERNDQLDQALYERDVAFAGGELDWRIEANQAEYGFAAAEAGKDYQHLTRQAAAEAVFSTQTGHAAADRDIAFAQAEATSWQSETTAENVEREARAAASADFQTAQYSAKTTALDELVDGLDPDPNTSGSLPWAEFEKERAAAEESAWANVRGDYLGWQADISAAYTDYANARSSAYYDSQVQIATANQTFTSGNAGLIQSHVDQVADTQRQFELDLADLAASYRNATTQAEHTYQRDYAAGVRDNDSAQRSAATSQRNDALDAAEQQYEDNYTSLDNQRQQSIARSSFELTRDIANSFVQRVEQINTASATFDNLVADALYTTSLATDGLEETLAQLAYDYRVLEAATFSSALSTLSSSPWADQAEAIAAAEETYLVGQLGAEERDRLIAHAGAAREDRLAQGAAGRQQRLTEANATASLAVQEATALLYQASGTSPSSLPASISPPTPDLGHINVISTSFAVAQPGSIGDGWYTSYLGNFYGYWHYGWSGYDSYYGASAGQYDFTWGYDGFAGAFGGFGAYYGSWGYGPGAFGWGGWSPSYVTTPTAATSTHVVDPEASITGYEIAVDALTSVVKDVASTLLVPEALKPFSMITAAAVTAALTAQVSDKILNRNGTNWDGERVFAILKASAPELIPFIQTHFTLQRASNGVSFFGNPVKATEAIITLREGEAGSVIGSLPRNDGYDPQISIWVELPDDWTDFQVAKHLLSLTTGHDDTSDLFEQWTFTQGMKASSIRVQWQKDRVLSGLQEAAEIARGYYQTLTSFIPGGAGALFAYELGAGNYTAAALEVVFMGPVGKLASKVKSKGVVALKAGGKLVASIPVSVIKKVQSLSPTQQGELLKLIRKADSGEEAAKATESFLLKVLGKKELVNVPASLKEQLSLHKDTHLQLLRDALQSEETGKAAHHIIPREAIPKFRRLLEKAADGGFNINGANNGIALEQVNHIGNHPQYNTDVLNELGQINRQQGKLSNKEVAGRLQKAADTLRKAIEDETYGPWG